MLGRARGTCGDDHDLDTACRQYKACDLNRSSNRLVGLLWSAKKLAVGVVPAIEIHFAFFGRITREEGLHLHDVSKVKTKGLKILLDCLIAPIACVRVSP